MTDASKVFLRETAAVGGPLPRDLLPERAKNFYDEIAGRADDLIGRAREAIDGLPPIHFGFIHNGEINAVAFRSDEQYFIGIYTGLLYMLRLVIGRMLADARTFPSIGDPSEEVGDLGPIADYVPHADVMNTLNTLYIPRNAVRRAYAEYIQDQAVMFFVGHEIAHISRGHVDYLSQNRGIPQSRELSDFGAEDAELRLERQCLEQDADRRSIISRIDSLRVTQQNPKHAGPPWAVGDKSPGPMIRAWNVSLSILFRLFGDVRFSPSELSRANYPPLSLRRLYAEVVGKWQIETAWDNSLHAVATAAFNVSRIEAEEAFAIILGKPMSMDGFKDAMSPTGVEHAMRLQDYWNSIMVEKLKPYSYEF
jgi:hypothetical protein